MKIKFCGMTNYEDARAALDLGVHYLGFIVEVPTSSRSIHLPDFLTIASRLPRESVVAVVKNPHHQVLEQLAASEHVGTIQTHDPTTALTPIPDTQQWVAIAVEIDTSAAELEPFRAADMLILDDPKRPLIPEEKHVIEITKQELVDEARGQVGAIGIAGGLNPYNVAHVVQTYSPDLIDMASGIESAPGRKDHQLMKLIFANLNL